MKCRMILRQGGDTLEIVINNGDTKVPPWEMLKKVVAEWVDDWGDYGTFPQEPYIWIEEIDESQPDIAQQK